MRRVIAGEWSWEPERLAHRQTYIDLIKAYLGDYGSQRDLARALGVSEVYISYLLKPVRLAEGHPAAHWSSLLAAAGYEVADAFRFAKTPSQTRARQIAEHLVTDADRRAALLYHVAMARQPVRPAAAGLQPLAGTEVRRALRAVGDIHLDALGNPVESVAAASYARVWRHARNLPAGVDPRRYPVDHAQALIFLHDTAQVLGRADLALGFARRALAVLPEDKHGNAIDYGAARLRINAILAEVVSLNTLALPAQASGASTHAESLTGFRDEPQTWLRSFLEQRLASMAALPRASRYEAESTADMALSLVPADGIVQAGIRRRLMDVYLTRLTARVARRAGPLASALSGAVAPGTGMSPLRRAQILRTLARYHCLAGDRGEAVRLIAECLRVTSDANLIHQRAELIRECVKGPRGRR